jgi:hypothetical protein
MAGKFKGTRPERIRRRNVFAATLSDPRYRNRIVLRKSVKKLNKQDLRKLQVLDEDVQ